MTAKQEALTERSEVTTLKGRACGHPQGPARPGDARGKKGESGGWVSTGAGPPGLGFAGRDSLSFPQVGLEVACPQRQLSMEPGRISGSVSGEGRQGVPALSCQPGTSGCSLPFRLFSSTPCPTTGLSAGQITVPHP